MSEVSSSMLTDGSWMGHIMRGNDREGTGGCGWCGCKDSLSQEDPVGDFATKTCQRYANEYTIDLYVPNPFLQMSCEV